MFQTLRHLLPDSVAWRVIKDRLLRQYLKGVSSAGTDAVSFVDDVSDDLYPQTTRELAEWQTQFGLEAIGTEQEQRDYLEYVWGRTRSQSPKALQDALHAAGFTGAYVYDWFDTTDVSWSKDDGKVADVSGEDTSPGAVSFGLGGLKMYVLGKAWNRVFEYNLTTPHDLSTATYAGSFIQLDAVELGGQDFRWSLDGTRAYVLGSTGDAISEYNLSANSPAWQVSSLVDSTNSLSVAAQETTPSAMAWHPDGTSVYVTGSSSDQVHQYDLTTPWDLGGTVTFNQSYNPSIADPSGLTFTDDGKRMLILAANTLTQFDLSTAWDISTASASGHTLDMSTEDTLMHRVRYERGYLFAVGQTGDNVYRYIFGGPRNPRDYTNDPLFGTTQCGDGGSATSAIAECGEEIPGQVSVDSAVCNRFFVNEVWYILNDNLVRRAPPQIPDVVTAWPHFWYVGGTPFGTLLNVPAADRDRLERLCLKYGPTEQWIVTLFNIT